MNDPDPDETELAATARVYVRAGWAVFPLWWVTATGACACARGQLDPAHDDYCGRRPDGTVNGSPGKHPLHHVAPHGVKNATRDETTVAAWWSLYPWANIGLPAHDNGLAILDVDVDKGGDESLAKLTTYLAGRGTPLPRTVVARTGSGGFHYLFRAPEGGIKSGSKVLGPNMPGIDTRGRGGYVVAAPSNHASGGVYEWINFTDVEADWPDIMTALMAPPAPAPRVAGPRAGGPVVEADRYAQAALDGELERVRSATSGERNHTLNHAAFRVGQLVAGAMLTADEAGDALLDAALSIGLTDTEARKTILSGFRASKGSPRRPGTAAA